MAKPLEYNNGKRFQGSDVRMNRKKRLAELEKEIHELEHNPDKAGQFEPRLIPLYREYQKLQKEAQK